MERLIKKIENGEYLSGKEQCKLLEFPKDIITLYLTHHPFSCGEVITKLVKTNNTDLLQAHLQQGGSVDLSSQIGIIKNQNFELFKILVNFNALEIGISDAFLAMEKNTRMMWAKELFPNIRRFCPISGGDIAQTGDCELFRLYVTSNRLLSTDVEVKIIKLGNKDIIKIWIH